MNFVGRCVITALALIYSLAAVAASEEPIVPIKKTFQASVIRGEIVFSNYCTLCHGITGEGNGRAAKLHEPRPANLRRSMVPDKYKEMIIRKGGAGWGRSPDMPSWQDELTEEQIQDVVNFLRTIAPADAEK
jgi:mono/diheme cytochrome c family protein